MSVTDPVAVAGTARHAVGEPCVLLKLGEIVLKGRNRHQFERLLHGNIRAAVRDTGLPVELLLREGVVVLRVARQERTPAEHASAVDRVAGGCAAAASGALPAAGRTDALRWPPR